MKIGRDKGPAEIRYVPPVRSSGGLSHHSNFRPSIRDRRVSKGPTEALNNLIKRIKRWGRPRPPKKSPKWQTGLDNMSPGYAMGLAPLTQPWGLVAAGVATIVGAKLSSWESYVPLFLFCIVSTAVYIALELYTGFRPERAHAFLGGIRTWIDTHTDQVIIVVSLVLGLWLVAKSIYLIVT